MIRTGGMIPLDGRVVEGEAMVNQSSITGESMPVAKYPGSPVYAGTVAEEGACVISVEKSSGSGRYDRVVRMIEESEKLKSTAEDKASRMADKLVPYTLGGTVLTYLLTRNMTKMLAVLMVDFSRIRLRGASAHAYTIIASAKSIYTGSGQITDADLANPEIVGIEAFALITHDLLIVRYGLDALKITAKKADPSVFT